MPFKKRRSAPWVLVAVAITLTQVSAYANEADLSLLRNLVGRYPVLDVNGDNHVTGILEVVGESQTGVGFRLADIVVDPNSGTLAAKDLITPSATTVLTREGDIIVQEHRTEDLSIRVEFTPFSGQVGVHATRCPKNGNCELLQINMANAPGTPIDSAAFFKSEEGSYRIELVGGEPPHSGNDSADVSTSGSEANLTFPYCQNQGGLCDPGYMDFAFAETKVFRKDITATHVLYTIEVGTRRYSWENRDGKIYFRNYQYQLASGQTIVLTHVMQKSR